MFSIFILLQLLLTDFLKNALMNLLKLSFFLVLIATFSTCSDDDDNTKNCVQSDWVGTYTGTLDCDGIAEDVTVTITANGSDDIIIKYEVPNASTEYDPLLPNSCDLDYTESDSGITITIDASIDGDNLTLKEIISLGGDTSTCDITAVRN